MDEREEIREEELMDEELGVPNKKSESLESNEGIVDFDELKVEDLIKQEYEDDRTNK